MASECWPKQNRGKAMTYSQACEVLGFTTPKSLAANAVLAKSRLKNLVSNAPAKYWVACMVLIRAAA